MCCISILFRIYVDSIVEIQCYLHVIYMINFRSFPVLPFTFEGPNDENESNFVTVSLGLTLL